MSISEERQELVRPSLQSGQPRQDIPPSRLAAALSSVILADRISNVRRLSCEQSDATGHSELVYAVYHATDSEPIGRASCNWKADRRFAEEDVSDELLLKHVAGGDKAAMHIMFARHRGRVSRFIQRMVRNPAIVDDLVSQVFLDVWRSANRFESRARVSTWLLSIARFKAMSSLRQRTYEPLDQDDMLGITDAADTPEAALDRKERSGILRGYIDKLSPAQRDVIDLFYYREKSIAEVSAIVGIPQATAKSRLFYARKQLARILVSAGFGAAAVQTSVDEAVV